MLSKYMYKIYWKLQENPCFLRLISSLQEGRILSILAYHLAIRWEDKKLEKEPTNGMKASQDYFLCEQKRTRDILKLLADKKSRDVWKAVVDYRQYRKPIGKNMYSWNDQYFPDEIIHLKNGEVFIDAGAFTGDTISRFLKKARKGGVTQIKKIIAFEPDLRNRRLLWKRYCREDKVMISGKALSDKAGKVFLAIRGPVSRIAKEGKPIQTTTLDSIYQCKEVTFIKMDIEGEELNALKGAKKVICRNRPKLAICIYHSNEDMLRIIEYIHSLVPEYRLYIRHHTRRENETVLYAVL